jgi:hypothetical protein
VSDETEPADALGGEPPLRQGIARNLKAGLRVAFFASAGNRLVVSFTQLAALIALSLASTLVWQMVIIGWPGQLTMWGLPDALFGIPLLLLAAWSMAALGGRPADTLALVIAVLAAGLWLDAFVGIAVVAAEHAPRGMSAWLRWGLYYGAIAWYVACVAVAGARKFRVSWPRRSAMAAIALVVIGYPMVSSYHERTLWSKRYDEEASPARANYDAAAAEDVLYSQPRLLEGELGALLPRRANRSNLYLVSVAGYADQDVFMREVNSVDALFAERFGTRGRSVRLVNNRGTAQAVPLATRTSLAQTLKRVGALMDPDEDVLFLFLTSHGSRDGRFSIQFYPFRFQDIAATEIRQMLDDAGIRNRVVVVSACYSGTFVEPLRSDDTLVMTASAKDRNSFGCSNEADFTYFGKAYFDEALRSSDSFIEAFDRALPVIAAREKKEEYTPSDPQRFVGANIAAKLEAWREANARDPERAR